MWPSRSSEILFASEGGFFKAILRFPPDYPQMPPKMTFVSEMWHPNSTSLGSSLLLNRYCFTVYPNGDVCISILHPPGDDKWGYESASERWLPIHTVESILISVISMLSSPNDSSPANLDAAVCEIRFGQLQALIRLQKEWRESREVFKKEVARTVRKSQESM